MKTEEQIDKEIIEKQEEFRLLKEIKKNSTRSLAIKELEEYSVEEKVEFFDNMYIYAMVELKNLESGKYFEDNDNEHYAWETLMEIIARNDKSFWNYYNSLKK